MANLRVDNLLLIELLNSSVNGSSATHSVEEALVRH
eukprot:CAMPEP_0185923432 /NCGR_PEP_ID=MMETSP0924C-20121207/11173_1 /TAXON_ID=321610 /ORGANISM="Perkinsus chesapeaki, Strain ATCC PRA-65" /LENGTH=35 /DNA_ID= /DNA_START= /DNA_END= /DNA_ORIENTATION=